MVQREPQQGCSVGAKVDNYPFHNKLWGKHEGLHESLTAVLPDQTTEHKSCFSANQILLRSPHTFPVVDAPLSCHALSSVGYVRN